MSVIALHQNSGSAASAGDELLRLRAKAARLDTMGLLEWVLSEVFPGRIAVVSSFAAESVVLLHHVAAIDPTTPVLFLNTGKLFGETLRYRDRLQDVLGLTDIRAIGPHPDDRKASDAEGTLWSRDPDACCHFRKVVPLARAVAGFSATITGRKRFQTAMRATMERVELVDGRFRINPLVDWNLAELSAYVEEKGLPKHPLVLDGYPSIGCMPCTRRVATGENYRAGRWAGFDKDECGIHGGAKAGIDGDGI
ncbi:MAG TPA: phosphoadenylyl-sulfate reductase [Micropepsaceae bacterium]|nr:phosphoadenylyl-sulfate reductase [Micropepsaceae bacterium]